VDPSTAPMGMSTKDWMKLDRKGKSHNMIMSFKFSVTKCLGRSYSQGIMG
jgi:hypothetical protein